MRRSHSTQTQSTASHCRLTSPTGVTIHGCTVRSPLTGCQVTSRLRDRFSRYSKWPDTFQIALVVTRLPDGQPRNHGSVPGKNKKFVSSPKRQDRFRGPSSLLFYENEGLYTVVKWPQRKSDHSPP